MTKERMFEIMGNISDKYVSEAQLRAKGRGLVKYACAAAAVLLVAGAAVIGLGLPQGTSPAGGIDGGPVPGGSEGDGANYSVAVYPADRSGGEVASAQVLAVEDEQAARAVPDLGSFVPGKLPDGLRIAGAVLYVTDMSDGTRYRMLRLSFTDGEVMPGLIDGGTGERLPDRETVVSSMSVWDHLPHNVSREDLLTPDSALELLAASPGQTVHIDFGGTVVSLHGMDAASARVILDSIEQ